MKGRCGISGHKKQCRRPTSRFARVSASCIAYWKVVDRCITLARRRLQGHTQHTPARRHSGAHGTERSATTRSAAVHRRLLHQCCPCSASGCTQVAQTLASGLPTCSWGRACGPMWANGSPAAAMTAWGSSREISGLGGEGCGRGEDTGGCGLGECCGCTSKKEEAGRGCGCSSLSCAAPASAPVVAAPATIFVAAASVVVYAAGGPARGAVAGVAGSACWLV